VFNIKIAIGVPQGVSKNAEIKI